MATYSWPGIGTITVALPLKLCIRIIKLLQPLYVHDFLCIIRARSAILTHVRPQVCMTHAQE